MHIQPVPAIEAPTALVLLVEPAMVMAGVLGRWLESTGRCRVAALDDPDQAVEWARKAAADPPQAVVFDLIYPRRRGNGLGILLAFSRFCPETALVIHTDAGRSERALLEVAWSRFQPLSVLSKSAPVDSLRQSVDSILATGSAVIDPAWSNQVQASRIRWKAMPGPEPLVPQAGHATLWAGLLDSACPPTWDELAQRTGLAVAALHRYRADLEEQLTHLGLTDPTPADLHRLAQLLRPLLELAVEQHLG